MLGCRGQKLWWAKPSFPEYTPEAVRLSGNLSTVPFLREAALLMLRQGCGEGWLLQPKIVDMPDLEYRQKLDIFPLGTNLTTVARWLLRTHTHSNHHCQTHMKGFAAPDAPGQLHAATDDSISAWHIMVLIPCVGLSGGVPLQMLR